MNGLHMIFHMIAIIVGGGCNRLFPCNTQKKGLFLPGKHFIMANDDYNTSVFSENRVAITT